MFAEARCAQLGTSLKQPRTYEAAAIVVFDYTVFDFFYLGYLLAIGLAIEDGGIPLSAFPTSQTKLAGLFFALSYCGLNVMQEDVYTNFLVGLTRLQDEADLIAPKADDLTFRSSPFGHLIKSFRKKMSYVETSL